MHASAGGKKIQPQLQKKGQFKHLCTCTDLLRHHVHSQNGIKFKMCIEKVFSGSIIYQFQAFLLVLTFIPALQHRAQIRI